MCGVSLGCVCVLTACSVLNVAHAVLCVVCRVAQIIAAISAQGIGVLGSCSDANMNGTYQCSYTATVSGYYLVGIYLDRIHVRNSPYAVFVNVSAISAGRSDAPLLRNLVRASNETSLLLTFFAVVLLL